MNIYDFDSYRTFLKSELAYRIERNPTYSLRAMAKNLGVASSTLSEVINGRANLSLARARQIGASLKLKNAEINYLCDLVELESQTDPAIRETILEKLRHSHPKRKLIHDLSLEHFKQMSDWYHLAILELVMLKGFDFNAENVADAIGISKPLAEVAIERLFKLELIVKKEDGKVQRAQTEVKIRSDIKHRAMRMYYRQMLEKISTALDEQSPQQRLSGYLNMPLDERALPEIDEAIDDFFYRMKSISKKYTNKTKVYHLSLHFIDLIKKEITNET